MVRRALFIFLDCSLKNKQLYETELVLKNSSTFMTEEASARTYMSAASPKRWNEKKSGNLL